MDCVICYNHIITSCITSCNHHFCYKCLIDWCKIQNTCPKCRTIIREIRPDREFDHLTYILLNSLANNKLLDLSSNFFTLTNNNTEEITITFPPNTNAGITLKNNNGPGVKITRLSYQGRGRICGLKEQNIILFLNNVPCINHKQAIDIIDHCMFSNKDLSCILIK